MELAEYYITLMNSLIVHYRAEQQKETNRQQIVAAYAASLFDEEQYIYLLKTYT